MTMATMQTSTALDDEEFILIRDVPVFREHVAQLSDGRNVTFDREVLERIVENCNRRIAETGDYAAITVGHTKRPGEPGEQPPVVGFAGPFRVGELAGKTAIFADFRIFKDMADVLSRFPRRSAEFRLTPDIRDTWLDPIALLGGLPPKLDLGLTLLYAEENIERYAAVMPGDANTFVPELVNTKPSNNKETYSMEPNELVAKVLEAIKAEPWYQWISARMEAEAAKEKAEEKADDNPAPAEQNAESLPSEEADITPEKARQILRDGEVHGKPLTEAQRGFFGAIAGKDREKDSIDPASLARYQVELDELRRELEAERAKRVDTERAAVIRELRQIIGCIGIVWSIGSRRTSSTRCADGAHKVKAVVPSAR